MNSTAIVASMFVALLSLEFFRGRLKKKTATADDRVVEIIATLSVPLLVAPAIVVSTYALMGQLVPDWQGAWGHLPVWAIVLILLLGDDMTQYWWHRLSHSVPFLFNFHRAHHEPRYISVRVAYRNSFLYFIFMPTIWISAVLVYLGFGTVFVIYSLLKALVIFGAHCAVPWDAFLYRHRFLSPVAWVVERAISTPPTHYAHHGMDPADGVTNYNGNYGNLLFFWDVLFGTARITRRYPTEFGIPGDRHATYLRQLFSRCFAPGDNMKALVCSALGSFDDLSVEEVDDPLPGDDEVLVDIVTAALNFPDILIVAGKYQIRPDLPFVAEWSRRVFQNSAH